jgi:transposase
MSRKLISMEQIKQILQLHNDGIGIREIARRTGLSRNSIRKYIGRVNINSDKEDAGLSDKQLASAAYEKRPLLTDARRKESLETHFAYAQKELGKTGVTRQLLWIEYKEQYADGYNYSQYCHHFKNYLKHTDAVMHLEYEAGDMIMIDFTGKKLQYVDNDTGEVIECEVFVAVLPYSGLIFCKAVHSQKTADFITCINAMLKYYSAVAKTILCDNLKTAVIRPCKYEPLFTDVCYQLSEHYQTTFSAARPYSPRDKAMVERAVSIVYSNVYAPLRHQQYHSLEQLNHAIKDKLHALNDKPYKKSTYSRRYLFEQNEFHLLKCLPSEPFSAKKMDMATVQRNYHIQLKEDKLYYSVPYTYVGKKVKVLYDERTVEVYCDHARIALHMRSRAVKGWSTILDHMPPNHQHMHKVKGWTKEDLLSQAARIGEYTCNAAAHMLNNSIYIEQNYKACYGMLMLAKKYTAQRLEAACRRAASGTRINYTMIKNILANGLDKQPLLFDNNPLPKHDNIRGSQHYQ